MNKHHILISLGTNIQREKYTRSGVKALKQHFDDVQLSSVYESESVGFDGDAFYNLVASAYTHLPVSDVCQILKQIEQDNGRTSGEKKFASRTLDLDLLTYDQLVTKEPVTLPRDEITYNAFVLQPLAELVPTHKHPLSNASYLELWQSFDSSKQKLWPITFNWSEGTHDAI